MIQKSLPVGRLSSDTAICQTTIVQANDVRLPSAYDLNMPKPQNSYDICIKYDDDSDTVHLLDVSAPYAFALGRTDTLSIWSDRVTLRADRSNRATLRGVLSNTNSTIENQLRKAMAYHDLFRPSQVIEVTFSRARTRGPIDRSSLLLNDI